MPNKVHLEKIRLNQGGYEVGGRYWGASDIALYRYYYDVEDFVRVEELRAADRVVAKERILKDLATKFPGIKFTFFR